MNFRGAACVAVFLVLVAGFTGSVYADGVRLDGCGGSGGEVPIPYNLTNQRAELAHGELYTLIGRIIISHLPGTRRGRAYLEVDFGEHPWLASAKRKAFPLYPIEGSGAVWRQYEGMRVRIQAEARGRVSVGDVDSEAKYLITLLPILESVTISVK